MKMNVRIAIAALLLAATSGHAAGYLPPPGDAWETRKPSREGFDAAKLKAAIDFAVAHETKLFPALDGTIDLVATSALLDLVSAPWLERLAAAVAARAIPLYAALSYDGRAGFTPQDPYDAAITTAVNAHQRTDKGFGPALGPAASAFAIARFEALGYAVAQGRSDWTMGADDRDMQNEILAGWASAARDMNTLPHDDITAWLARRRDAVAGGRSSLYVGHVDFLAIPSATR